jgi:hypothetical protein
LVIGGSEPPLGLYRQRAGEVTHYPLEAPVRALAADTAGGLFVAAGCGVLRYRDEAWETLAAVDCTDSSFSTPLVPVGLAVRGEDDLWVAGVWGTAHYAGGEWTIHPVNATRVLLAPDGSVWVEGWDGRAGSHCCIGHLGEGGWVTYTVEVGR